MNGERIEGAQSERSPEALYIARDGVQTARPYGISEARELLEKGILRTDDWAWQPGMSDWLPLAQLLDQTPASSARLPSISSVDEEPAAIETEEPQSKHRTPLQRITSLFTWMGASERKRVDPVGLGHELWGFTRATARQISSSLFDAMRKGGTPPGAELEARVIEEMTMVHLWLTSRLLAAEKIAVDELYREYTARPTVNFPITWEERANYTVNAKATLRSRIEVYESAWNRRSSRNQRVLAAYVLKNLLGEGHARSMDAHLIQKLHDHLLSYPTQLDAFRRRFETRERAK